MLRLKEKPLNRAPLFYWSIAGDWILNIVNLWVLNDMTKSVLQNPLEKKMRVLQAQAVFSKKWGHVSLNNLNGSFKGSQEMGASALTDLIISAPAVVLVKFAFCSERCMCRLHKCVLPWLSYRNYAYCQCRLETCLQCNAALWRLQLWRNYSALHLGSLYDCCNNAFPYLEDEYCTSHSQTTPIGSGWYYADAMGGGLCLEDVTATSAGLADTL